MDKWNCPLLSPLPPELEYPLELAAELVVVDWPSEGPAEFPACPDPEVAALRDVAGPESVAACPDVAGPFVAAACDVAGPFVSAACDVVAVFSIYRYNKYEK